MSGSTRRTEHIRDKRDSKQGGAVGSEAQGDACGGSGGRLSLPWIGPGRSERTRDGPSAPGTGAGPVRPPRTARGRSARRGPGRTKPAGGGGGGVPFLRLSIPPERARPAASAIVRAEPDWGWHWRWEWKAGLFLRPPGERQRSTAGPLLPPRGRGAVANERSRRVGERRCQGLSWERRRRR